MNVIIDEKKLKNFIKNQTQEKIDNEYNVLENNINESICRHAFLVNEMEALKARMFAELDASKEKMYSTLSHYDVEQYKNEICNHILSVYERTNKTIAENSSIYVTQPRSEQTSGTIGNQRFYVIANRDHMEIHIKIDETMLEYDKGKITFLYPFEGTKTRICFYEKFKIKASPDISKNLRIFLEDNKMLFSTLIPKRMFSDIYNFINIKTKMIYDLSSLPNQKSYKNRIEMLETYDEYFKNKSYQLESYESYYKDVLDFCDLLQLEKDVSIESIKKSALR